jgi:Mlc titration factor MtfA (ptsG expression regulator)
MLRWLRGQGARAAQVADMQARIAPELWREVCAAYPFLDVLEGEERAALQARCAWLLASKTMNGARGQVLTDAMRLAIAAQACLPILQLAPELYEGWDEIIVYPAAFRVSRRHEDDAGVVHEYVEEAMGEAWDGGPVILSWEDSHSGQEGANVVIHEFAHKLDLHAGSADGLPDLGRHPDLSPRLWMRVLESSFTRFEQLLEDVERDIPADIDPEGPEADAWYGRLPLDPYAATDLAEFFAVSAEAFFIDPEPLAQALPQWYAMLESYFRQDTLKRAKAMAGRRTALPPDGPA